MTEEEQRRAFALEQVKALYPQHGVILILVEDNGETCDINTASTLSKESTALSMIELTAGIIRDLFSNPTAKGH
jgi:hypothetical protein